MPEIKPGLCSLILRTLKERTNVTLQQNFTLKENYSFEQSLLWKSTGSVTISLLAAGQKVSLVIFLINKLGHRGQLDICRALINGACTWRDKNKLVFLSFSFCRKAAT